MSLIVSKRMRSALAQIGIVLFVFFIPLSTTLKTLFLIASLLVILSQSDYKNYILMACNTAWGLSSLALFVFAALACLWSPASYSDQLAALGKYSKLVFFPILAVGFMKPQTRYWAINSYLIAMMITCIVSILKSRGLVFSGDPGEVVYNYIITGFMMALACYLAALCAFQFSGWLRVLYLLVVVLTSYQILFINSGRTGYVVYFILTCLLFLEQLSFKKALIAIFFSCGLMGLMYSQSVIMQSRVSDLINDVKFLQQNNKNTSLGYRIQFHRYAKDLFKEHPLLGVGTGGFKSNFMRDDPVPSWGIETPDPHSQYWMVLSEFGVLGFFLFLIFLWSLLVTSMKLKQSRPIILGVLTTFCMGSLSDTLFCYSTVGYLLIVFSALCFGELLEQSPLPTSHALFRMHKTAFFRK